MANITHSIFSLVFIINIIFLSFSCYALAGRDKIKHPDTFGTNEGTVLIPGFGRVVVPPKGSHVNPFTYNPITGSNNGNGLIIPNPGSGTGIGTYIPGGDDVNSKAQVPSGGTGTYIPGGDDVNSKAQVPSGGTIPVPP